MGSVTPLINLMTDLESLDLDATIYVAEPWTRESLAMVEVEPASGGLPEAASRHSLAYFLEVSVARDFLADWQSTLDKPPTDQERCDSVIRYAVDDA
ncbi:MAG: hypothetical protein KDI19_05610 [Pseudomonadales bacterium]|nr:hypothetical protein [Pseudomonadales bacterium]